MSQNQSDCLVRRVSDEPLSKGVATTLKYTPDYKRADSMLIPRTGVMGSSPRERTLRGTAIYDSYASHIALIDILMCAHSPHSS